jgi:uncharacterized protein
MSNNPDLTVLIHSSKTMRSPQANLAATAPVLLPKVKPLAAYLQTLSLQQLQTAMQISPALAQKVYDSLADWSTAPSKQSLAIDSFVGDIYSGLRASSLSKADRDYAQKHLRILSGLYGILRPYDGVRPYRLEMGYTLPNSTYGNLYAYWAADIATSLPEAGLIVNLSAAEYTKTVLPYINTSRVVAPRFLTLQPKTGKPGQVIVHTKIARGAFARWLIMSRVTEAKDLKLFDDLDYHYQAALSTPQEPVFVCETFGGIGLSMRLEK